MRKIVIFAAFAAVLAMGRTAEKFPVRIERESIVITPDSAGVRAVVTLANDLDEGAECILATYWLSASGDTLAVKHSYTHVPAQGTWTFDMSVPMAQRPASVSMDLRGDGFVNQSIDRYSLAIP
ncbi:MAG: hypothetical protein LIP09_10465 [Bacteroidales bacterium]|nr:hypothetical protein [Bacteroidales bacterium]